MCSFGDITSNVTNNDIEDIFNRKSKFNDSELDTLKEILINLNSQEYPDRKTYDKTIKQIMHEYKGKLNGFPSKVELNILNKKLEKAGIVGDNKSLKTFMKRKFCRSGSGELPVSVFTSPSRFDCPENCFYCPDEKEEREFTHPKTGRKYTKKVRIQPRSYLSKEPGCMRAAKDKFDPLLQTFDRIHSLEIMGHETDKIRFIVLGGTYCYYPMDYRIWFMTSLYYACNTYYTWKTRRDMLSLEEEMRINRDSDVRVVGITVETRPDRCTLEDCAHFMSCGITTVQLGIQQLDDAILKGVNRNCTVEQIKIGTKRVLDCGLKLDAHYMFDLPGPGKHCRLSPKQDKKMVDLITKDPDFAVADQWKLYPCSTTPYTQILKWYQNKEEFLKNLCDKTNATRIQSWMRRIKQWPKFNGKTSYIDLSKKKYQPYAEIDKGSYLVDAIIYATQNVNKDTRINRVIRDIPNSQIVGGNQITNLRQHIIQKMKDEGLKPSKCIRTREIQLGKFDIDTIKIDVFCRKKAGSDDYFVSFEDAQDRIYGLARLRLLNENSDCLPMLKNSAVIREVHVYGATVKTSIKDSTKPQHSGLGTKLIKKCEDIARENGYEKIFITSGEGVIRYYENKHGYKLIEDEYNGTKYHYVVKSIDKNTCLVNTFYVNALSIPIFMLLTLIEFIWYGSYSKIGLNIYVLAYFMLLNILLVYMLLS